MLNQTQISVARACTTARRLLLDGDHAGAIGSLLPFWEGLYSLPILAELTPVEKVELLTICGRVTTAKARATQTPGLYDEAEKLLQQAIRLADDEDLPLWEAQDALAHCFWRQGNYKAARKVLKVALAIVGTDQTDEYVYLAATLCMVECMDGKLQAACKLAEAVADLAEGVKDPMTRARFFDARANTFNLLGLDYGDEALLQYTGASVYFELAGHRRHAIAVENNIANLLIKMGRPEDAHEYLNRVFNFYLSISDRSALGQVLETRAQAYLAGNRFDKALEAIDKSIDYLESGDEKKLLAESYKTKGEILTRLGRHGDAEEARQTAKTLNTKAVTRASCLRLVPTQAQQKIAKQERSAHRGDEGVLRLTMPDASLRDLGIHAGDQVVIELGTEADPGDLCAVAYRNEIYVGVYFAVGQRVILEADNREYEDLEFKKGDVKIKGKVIGYIKSEDVEADDLRVRRLDGQERSSGSPPRSVSG